MNLERVMPLGQDLSGKLDDIPWHHSSLFIVCASFQSNFYNQLSSSFMIIMHYNILIWDRKIIISTVSFFFFLFFFWLCHLACEFLDQGFNLGSGSESTKS